MKIRVLLVGVLAAVLLTAGGLSHATAQQPKAVSREHIQLGERLERAIRRHKVDQLTVLAAIRATREKDQTMLNLFASYEARQINTRTLVAQVTEIQKRGEGEIHILSMSCQDFADGYQAGCIVNGGNGCGEQADIMYCACLGGQYMGGQFCLIM